MQQAIQIGVHRWSPIRPATLKAVLVAGFALVGVGLITGGPTGSPALPNVQHHDVQLVDQWVNPIDPTAVFPLALQNIDSLQTAIADVPLNDALNDLFTGYSERLAGGFEESAAAFQELAAQYPVTLQNTLDFLADGEFVEAYAELNSFGLFGAEDIAAPLFDLFSSRREEGIIPDLAQQTYNVINTLFTRGDLVGLTKALAAPGITANFEAALIADNIEEALSSGDYNDALNDLFNAPSQILGAYLNGATFPFVENGETFPGLLSPSGPFGFLFVTIPTQIANAISAPATVAGAPAEALAGSDWSTLFGDWGSLFDAGNLSSLFDAGDLSALFDVSALTETVTSAVDPGVFTDELTALATSIF